jgi:hypothetical protein
VEHGGAMAEFDFRRASIDKIDAAFHDEGCVLLRNFAARDDIERLRGAIDSAAPQDAVHFSDWEMRAHGLSHFCDYLFGEKHRQLVSRLLGGYYRISRNTSTRRIDSIAAADGHQRPLEPHLDAFFHSFYWTINFWIPFRACGRDAPSLGVVRAPTAETQAFTGYDGRRRRSRPPPQWNFANFANTNFAVDDLRSAFEERMWAPEYALGDAMLLSNWTLHFTHSLPEMTEQRGNVELRFTARASLGEALSDALGPTAARMLTSLRRVFPSGDAAHPPRSH